MAGTPRSPKLDHPRAAVPTPDGGFLIADTGNRVVRRVAPDGTISTVAGNGVDGSDGDGGPATAARLGDPDDVAPTPGGGFLIADYKHHVVRRVAPDGTISTVVGDPSQGGSTGDGGPAADALLDTPTDVEVLPDGGFLIADHDRDRVRHVRAGRRDRAASPGPGRTDSPATAGLRPPPISTSRMPSASPTAATS